MEWHDPRAPASPVDITSAVFRRAPIEAYGTIRNAGRVVWQPQSRGFLITGYADNAAALRDPRFLAPDLTAIWRKLQQKLDRDYLDAIELFSAMPFMHEGREHDRLRRALAVMVAPFAAGTPEIGVCIDRRVRRILRAGAFDVAADFAAHLLFDVMCEMIRIPESERGELRPVSTMSWALETTLPIARRDRAAAEIHRSRAYLVEHVSRPAVRAASPFVAAAYAALSGEDGQDVGRAVATLVEVMLVMGNDALGACVTFPVERLKAVAGTAREVPQREWETIADDAIRYAAPVDFINRIVRGDAVFAGCDFHDGDRLIISPLSANHDPAEFGPATGAVTAKPGKATGLTFGAGSHLCVGNRFSRTIVRAAFAGLASLPDFRLDGPAERGPGYIIRTVASLPATLH
jgi:cytochrome P450